MHSFLRLSVAASVLLSASAAFAADPLVDVDWVTANLDAEDVVFVDLRPKPSYLEAHIPGAVHTQYGGPEDEWRTKVGSVRGLVRDHDLIAEHLGEIGISNDDHVVLIPAGTSSSDMGAATRIYWTMNYLGHDEVSILNGGMAAYVADLDADKKPRNPLQAGAVDVDEEDFVAMPRPEMLLSAEDVEGLAARGALLVDNRTDDFHLGLSKSGAATEAGTLPGAKNLPHTWITTNAEGAFRDTGALGKLYQAAGIPVSGPQVNFCNTGHLASIGWFVSHELLGNDEALLYDGSMADWTHSGREAEQKIRF